MEENKTIQEKVHKGYRRRWIYAGIALTVVAALIIIIVPSVVVTHKKQQHQFTQSSNNGNNNSSNENDNSNNNNNTDDVHNNDNGHKYRGSNATTFKPAYAHAGSKYANLTRVLTLDHLSDKHRIFVVGDVHGCANELGSMIKKLNYDRSKDAMILAGDLISKGYDNSGVLQLAQSHRMYCVRGNHDDYVIRFKTYENLYGIEYMRHKKDKLPEGDVEDPMEFGDEHADMAKNLTRKDYEYLVQCPMLIDLPFLNAQVVHGGLDPNINDFSQNDPYTVFNIRSIQKNGVPTKKKKNGDHWTDDYATAAQQGHGKSTPLIKKVYYGHDASRGLDLQKVTFGLDSRCVYGGHLTAMDIKTHWYTQVQCGKYYE